MKKLSLFLVIALVFSVTSVFALDFDVTYEAIDDVIKTGETAIYNLTVTLSSNETNKVNFIVFASDIDWILSANPYTFAIDPTKSKTQVVELRLRPSSYTYQYKTYGVQIRTVANDKLQKDISLPLVYTSGNLSAEYNVDVIGTMEVSEKVNPSDKLVVRILLRNQNRLDVKGLTLNVSTPIKGVELFTTIDVGPLEKKTFEYVFDIDDQEKPAEHPITFQLLNKESELSRGRKVIQILENIPKFLQEEKDSETLFTKTKEIRLTNPGNVENTQRINIASGFFESKFTSIDGLAEYDSKTNSFNIDVTLAPGASDEIVVFVSYKKLTWSLLIILIIVVINYVFLRHPLSVHKKVVDIDEIEGLKELKVQINVRNNSNKFIKKITVNDYIPRIGKYKKADELSEVPKKEIRGASTVVSWTIESLDPKEERIITYKIHTKLPVLGEVSLERAKAVITTNGTEKASYSNAVKVSESRFKGEEA